MKGKLSSRTLIIILLTSSLFVAAAVNTSPSNGDTEITTALNQHFSNDNGAWKRLLGIGLDSNAHQG